MSNDSSSSVHGQTPSTNGRLLGNARGELERHILESVKGTDRLILRELFGFFRGKAVCWPGNEAIAKEAGVCPRTVQRSLKALEDAEIIKTVDDSSTRSRRRIILLAHPCSGEELAKLEASPHTRFDRCRIGAPTSNNCQGRMSNCRPKPRQNDIPEGDKLSSESRNRSSARLEDSRPDGGTGGEKTLPNGNGKPEEKPAPVAIAEPPVTTHPNNSTVPLSPHQLRVKAMAEGGDRASQVEWDAICRAMLLTAPPEQIVAEVLRGGATTGIEFLERLRPGAPPGVFDQAVEVLYQTFGPTDRNDSRHAYQGIMRRFRAGKISHAVITYAYRQATLPSAENPGRVFIYNVENRKGLQC